MKLRFLSTIRQNKVAFGLNIIGLSVAFTVLTVIILQVNYEFNYDNFYKDTDRIYRLEYFDKVGDEYGNAICAPLIDNFAEAIPGIESLCLLWDGWDVKITTTDTQGNKRELQIPFNKATPGFFDTFSPEIIAGDTKTCLEGDLSVAISESIAKKIFGYSDPLGKSFEINGTSVTVQLIYKDFPENSTVKNSIYMKLESEDWSEWSQHAYFKLATGVSPDEMTKKLQAMDLPGVPKDDLTYYKERLAFCLTPMKDLYFKSPVLAQTSDRGNIATTFSLLAIAILIISIAYVNFINFSTALAPIRIKKINTQKVMGATPGELRRTIIGESLLISMIALGLSYVWTNLFIASPAASFFTANLSVFTHIPLAIGIFCIALVLGVLAGIYPAFYMTSFQPALVLKGSFALSPTGTKLRNSLLLFQFVTTIVLITTAAFIKLQHTYMQNMNTGYERENVLYIQLNGELKKQMASFTNELMARTEILDNARTAFLPGNVQMGWGRSFDGKKVVFTAWPVSHNFLRFFNINIESGTDFFEHNEKGANKVIFNHKFLEKYDFKEDIIGKDVGCFNNMGRVVGIAKDVNFNSVREAIDPMAFICGDDQQENYILLKVSGKGLPETINYIRKVCKQFSSENREVKFLNETVAKLYQKEENFAKLISIFSLITILISLMGIYGLILFNARFKMKEIGVRKVNGATEAEMIIFLNKGFLKLILISFVVAVPAAWYIVSTWLESFPYKTPIHWWVFLAAGTTTFIITILTVSWQSWKAASANPVKALKND